MGNTVVKEEPKTYFKSLTLRQIFFMGGFLLIAIFVLYPKKRKDKVVYTAYQPPTYYQNRIFEFPEFRNVNYEDNITAVTPENLSIIIHNIWNDVELLYWEYYDYEIQPVCFVTLNQNSSEYQNVKHLFLQGTTKFQIYKIERVQNVYLVAAFLLKKEEIEQKYPSTPLVVEALFHGTKKQNVMSICTENFNWRLSGKNGGNRFGKGVSFTPISHYATYYGDEDSTLKVMFLANVLIGKECVGSRYMELPPPGYDTTTNEDRQVIVKYEDNEFYPAYKITYYCTSQVELEKRKFKNCESRRYTPRPFI